MGQAKVICDVRSQDHGIFGEDRVCSEGKENTRGLQRWSVSSPGWGLHGCFHVKIIVKLRTHDTYTSLSVCVNLNLKTKQNKTAKESEGLGCSSSAGGGELCDPVQATQLLWTSNSLICKWRGLSPSRMPFKVPSTQYGSTCRFPLSKWGVCAAKSA